MERIALILLIATIVILMTSGCTGNGGDKPSDTDSPLLSGSGAFSEYYQPLPLEVNPSAPQYPLPLDLATVTNRGEATTALSLDRNATAMLVQNGFVVVENPFNRRETDIVRPYSVLKTRGVPVFVTADSVLHLYHIQFDETMRTIEEERFYDDLWALDAALLNASIERLATATGDEREAALRNAAYFGVAQALLAPAPDQISDDTGFLQEDAGHYAATTLPAEVASIVDAELALIRAHGGLSESPIFTYTEDYSQYVPRGHYTRSERLKNYFLAMMWHGRLAFLLTGGEEGSIVSAEEAAVQTAAAAQIAAATDADPALMERWNRIYTVTAFYAGYSDDLGPADYIEAMKTAFGSAKPTLTADEIASLQEELRSHAPPAIYSGTGDQVVSTEAEARQALNATMGFRFMGQRFVPDSYVFSELVYPYAGSFTGTGDAFTMVEGERAIPTALDVMALLGSERAAGLLDEGEDSRYLNYTEVSERLEGEFAAVNESGWTRNLYWGWLHAQRPLLETFGEGYPAFMQTPAWREKELTTSLASWTELRHDTILYAKQSYTFGKAIAVEPMEQEVSGYVEPVPEVYTRLHALTVMTRQGLADLDALDGVSERRLQSLESVLERLADISARELNGEDLTPADHAFIRNVGDVLDGALTDVDEQGKTTAIVADVHTNPFHDLVLEEGVGYTDLVVVACPTRDGSAFLAAGPVLSYYEFTVPLSGRLTDEAWQAMLRTDPPDRPWWTAGYASLRSGQS
ncbi:DUF3160 domain-containing protein [Methanofollis fontis]|uniref:dTDP-glucose 4,6-dehydratase n=1 Tax=Methanofollis fontis TaxID=2052832 RepID=A0A483CNP3_9EURY|nr:DUF3160 domain-containing protein [Methanofollis fontis]TAJ43647.1 dTDP-glucose 4,6-dehydratase [Methanofollis fontis]